ncbi:hypothetical protein DR64_8522 [Paraburkholderia xenovorans LB400]|nr:hypothetical protein DR64_8522 [Paraburkholderia xenovorans LB400]
MKGHAILAALGALAIFSSGAFAQGNQPSSSQSLNAGDNVQAAPTPHSTHTHKKMKSGKSAAGTAAPTTQPGGTATPGGPNAPVSASGSGQ